MNAENKADEQVKDAKTTKRAVLKDVSKGQTSTPASRIISSSKEGETSSTPDLASPEWYLNRELTWLNFCWRVLYEAEDERTQLLERVKFLSIVGSNKDEFIMKRIGGLKQQVGAGLHQLTIDGRTPQEQIRECNELIRALERR